MQPASKPIKTEVKFYELTPKTDSSKARVSPPNTKIVQQLGLGDDPNARIEFEYRGTDIYAKAQTAPKRAKLSWGAHRRSRNRKDAARLALSRLTKDINGVAGAQKSSEVQEKLALVRAQVAQSSCVRAEDLQALFDITSNAAKAHAEKLEFDTIVQGVAARLNTPAASAFIKNLPFAKVTINDFLTFIKTAATRDLSLVETKPFDYSRAIGFAKYWTNATPKSALGSPKDRYLIDHLVSLVMRRCDMNPDPVAQNTLPQFEWRNDKTLVHPDGREFTTRAIPTGKGAHGATRVYGCGDETVVVKRGINGEEQMKMLAEAQVHAQAKTVGSDNIVGILGTALPPGDAGPVLILQHAPNGNVRHVLGSLRELDKEAASQAFMTLFADMVKGTSRAHAAGVMHLDLKPENFFVDENAELQLGDYGTARRTLADTMKSPTDSPEYSAPELINAIKKPALMTWQADVWSLGVMLYEMNSPREGDREHPPSFLPFPYQDRFTSQAAGHINVFCGKANKDDRIEQLNLVEMNPPLRELIIQMLDPDPAKRPSLEEVIANPLVAPYANPITPNEQALVANARQFILELAELHLAT